MFPMGYCKYCFRHIRKEIDMKKILTIVFMLFGVATFAKTWEANLRSCDGYGGFWFPNHNWTDKGEPWIKPFMKGESLEDYKETGISFNYEEPKEYCSLSDLVCPDVVNPFGMRWTPIPLDKRDYPKDSIYFFMTSCGGDSALVSDCKNGKLLEEFSFDDFTLEDVDKYNLDESLFFDLRDVHNYLYGIFFVYKKYDEKLEYNALCNVKWFPLNMGNYSYEIQCEFQDDGTLNFDKLPDVKTIPEDFCSTQFVPTIRLSRFKQRNNYVYQSFYKVDGTPAFKNASNIVIKSKQSILQLKGEH